MLWKILLETCVIYMEFSSLNKFQFSIPPPPPPDKFYSPDDNVMLEDESGRMELVGEPLKDARLVTGVIIGVLGFETPDGEFEVLDICYPGMAPQAPSDAIDSPQKMEIDGELVCSLLT